MHANQWLFLTSRGVVREFVLLLLLLDLLEPSLGFLRVLLLEVKVRPRLTEELLFLQDEGVGLLSLGLMCVRAKKMPTASDENLMKPIRFVM